MNTERENKEKKKSHKRWTEQEYLKLAAAYDAGKSCAEMAQELGRTEATIQAKGWWLVLRLRPKIAWDFKSVQATTDPTKKKKTSPQFLWPLPKE